jgi:BlaI family penicillinase repressor
MKLSDAEWNVMQALWQHSPASVRDVLEALQDSTGWSYSTVKTMLERLAEKEALRVQRRGNVMLYEPLITRQQAQRAALGSLLEKAFDGAFGSLVACFVEQESLSPKERRKLAEMLIEADAKGSRRRS